MTTALYAALLAALPAIAPVSQTVVTAPPAPPPMPMAPPPIIVPAAPADRPASIIEIEFSAGARLLWSGTVRAGYGRPASFRQSLDQAGPDGCGPELMTRQASQRVEVSVAPAGYRPEPDQADRFMVQATWARPASPGSCADPGSNIVQIQRIVTLRAGGAIEVEGDGGLRIRLRRVG